jgi:hypothetical protein
MIPDPEANPMPSPEELATVLGNYLDLVKNHANEIGWLLDQHAGLRSEYITFFKKDLKEIESSLQGMLGQGSEPPSHDLIKQIIADFRKDLERSYELLNFTFFWKLAKLIEAGGSGYEQITPS